MCYDAQAVQTFRENIVRDIVPVVSRLRLKTRSVSASTRSGSMTTNFSPRRRPDALRQGRAFAAAQKMYDAMGDVPGAFFRMMCENEAWTSSRARTSGAAATARSSKFRQPFILANFNGTSGDVDVDARGRPRAQRLPDRGQGAGARLRRHGDRRDALDGAWSFSPRPYLDAFFPEGGRRGALPLPARAR